MAASEQTSSPQTKSSVIYRSRIEIGRILQGLVDDSVAVFAYVADREDDYLFISSLHSVHPDADSFVLSYGSHKSTNGALFRHAALKFKANYKGGRISFMAQRPLDATFGGQPVIKFVFPKVLLHYYREYSRITIPGEVSLRCLAEGPDDDHLDLQVIDISQDGMGCILYRGGSALKKGMVLKNCRISLPNGETVLADLMVRHSQPVTMKDGTIGCRTGVRFVQTPDEIKPLIEQFVRILDEQ